MTDICHYACEGIKPQLQLNSDPFSLQAPEDWYQGGNVSSGHVNMSTGCVINRGLFSCRMSPGLASKAIVDAFSFGEKPELIFFHDTSVKEMHTDQAVDDILDAYVRPYARAIGDAFVLQEDNMRLHRARIVDAYLEQETIQRMQ
ncbi:DDE_3 domain-containing protein [Trichonephila clavipes]|nr:DDE_3 domain-containing protein [Trichonephila clavipes]